MDAEARIAELERKIRELTVFHEVGKALTSTLDINRILETIMQQISSFFHPDTWSLLMVDEEAQELRFEIAVGEAAEKLRDIRLKLDEGIAGWVVRNNQPVYVPDTAKDPRFSKRVDDLTMLNTNSIACIPVRGREGVLGVIELINCPQPLRFDEEDLFLLQALADYAAIAIENARHVQKIHELTITDDCTKLFNARHLYSVLDAEIHRSTRYNYEFSLLFIDLDYFKHVNDVHGHLVGSKLLAELGHVIQKHLRLIDLAFRYGGDEFVILLPQTTKAAAIAVAKRLHALICKHVYMQEEGLNLQVTASFGVASFPADATTKADLIGLADQAMYEVKKHSRNNIAVAHGGLLIPTEVLPPAP
jgi:diguanylate cyclase (GGDEF)-like protein